MTKGFIVTRFVQRFMTHFSNGLLAIAVVTLLTGSPLSLAGSKTVENMKSDKSEIVAGKININKASAEQIAASLNGVGLKKAQAIVNYRRSNGSFKHAEQLLEVKGIGEAILKKNKGNILL